MIFSIKKLLALSSRLSTTASIIEGLEPARVRDSIVRRLGRFGLGRLPVPVFAGRVAIFVFSHGFVVASRAINKLPPILWKYNIALEELLPFKVEVDFLVSGRTDEAISYCQGFLRRHPDAYLASLLLIDLYLATDRVRDAVDLMKTMSRSCKDAEGLYGVGRRLMSLIAAGNVIERTAVPGVQKAVQTLNRELQGDETYRSVAKRCLDQAVEGTPPTDELHHKSLYWRGVLHIEQDEPELAERDFRAVLAGGRRYSFAYAFLADLCERRGNVKEAIDLLAGAGGELKTSLPIVERLTRLRLAAGDIRGALETAGQPPANLIAHIVADVR